jgi:hypothetical protein
MSFQACKDLAWRLFFFFLHAILMDIWYLTYLQIKEILKPCRIFFINGIFRVVVD